MRTDVLCLMEELHLLQQAAKHCCPAGSLCRISEIANLCDPRVSYGGTLDRHARQIGAKQHMLLSEECLSLNVPWKAWKLTNTSEERLCNRFAPLATQFRNAFL